MFPAQGDPIAEQRRTNRARYSSATGSWPRWFYTTSRDFTPCGRDQGHWMSLRGICLPPIEPLIGPGCVWSAAERCARDEHELYTRRSGGQLRSPCPYDRGRSASRSLPHAQKDATSETPRSSFRPLIGESQRPVNCLLDTKAQLLDPEFFGTPDVAAGRYPDLEAFAGRRRS